ncbi:zinc-dependent metalloprotease [Pseudoalteromonas sp. MMG024]|uniref:zinc-dependent metalloprotease n=1 Tax=Pseudoalteromonas sp. MMG024 TaxID=2909980 RepID=UPI001F42F2CD|nr:zinc-dependent metalloprotease [Pseudoalteromonas sp. MMG024]MCF6458323.1 zinc-dependent metalloprotease [Pseudoalteromonas sp. MMG024]
MKLKLLTLAVALSFATSGAAMAKDDKKKDEKKDKTLAEMLEKKTASEGLFNLYQDKKTGETMMVISEANLNKPYVYFAHTVDGVIDAGHVRGSYRETKLIEFRRHFDRIDIISKTPRYKFDPNNAIAKASDANISEAVLASLKIEKEEDGKFALKVDKLFKSEALHKVSPWKRAGDKNAKKRFNPGKLDDKKSRILSNRNYTNNLDVVVDYVFKNANPSVRGTQSVTDPRTVSIKVQHSFIELPQNDYQPRKDDSRVGYFGQQFDDMTTSDWAPYQDYINRWNLVKKDPNAAISEPVEPITWWIENTTPVEWRETVKEGVLAWNLAFEKAGFKNAIEVKVQPDDADWDAGDINYNVLRWTSSPRPPFGGYGPSLANPLTGQILGSDIMLEYVFMKNRWMMDSLYSQAASSNAHNHETASQEGLHCSQGHELQQGMMLANSLATTDIEKKEILEQGLKMLILHEVGHTLGLNHNMKASILWDEKEVHDKAKTQGILTGSVMDYTPANIAPKGMTQGDYFQDKPGPYDDWAIEYGYSQSLTDATAEAARLESILKRSSEHGLAFGNDADDMRAPGRHIDPRVMIGDMSSNAVAYAKDRMELVNQTFGKLEQTALNDGESYQELLIKANMLFGQYRAQAGVVSRYIGGVYVERDNVGSNTQPYTPVPLAKQKEAMNVLTDLVFAPDTLSAMEPLLNKMQHQRRGFSHYGKNEDPKYHAMVLRMQKNVLAQLLHPNVMTRISDTTKYGNEYDVNSFLNDLTAAVFVDAKSASSVSHNVQTEYVQSLIKIAGINKPSKHDNLAKAAAFKQLQDIQGASLSWGASDAAKAQKAYIDMLIEKALKA